MSSYHDIIPFSLQRTPRTTGACGDLVDAMVADGLGLNMLDGNHADANQLGRSDGTACCDSRSFNAFFPRSPFDLFEGPG